MKEGKLGWSGLILLVRGSLAQSEDPRVDPTRGAPKFHFWFYVWATRQVHVLVDTVNLIASFPAGYALSQRPMGRQDGV
jgi:hypothetical protein